MISRINPHYNVLRRIKRGLSGYVSYLAACEMNSSFSEYILYEPILRILSVCEYKATCEKICPGFAKNIHGDKKRIDFEATHQTNGTFVMEVKWVNKQKINIDSDCEKLVKYHTTNPNASCYLCFFGKKSNILNLKLDLSKFHEIGEAVIAEFGQTRFGCRIYILENNFEKKEE